MKILINERANCYPENEPLACPGCEHGSWHQHQMASCFGSEDSPKMRLTEANHAGTSVTEISRMKEHARRNSFFIAFWCEFCDRTPVLRIVQHKGGTYIEWMPMIYDRPIPPDQRRA